MATANPAHHRIRVVLMSATFDYRRYCNFFAGVPGCQTIETINLETVQSFDAWYTQITTNYLEETLKMLIADQHKELAATMRHDPNLDLTFDQGKTLSPQILVLIRALVAHLDKEEPVNAPFLIFAPTYRYLEQIFNSLSFVQCSSGGDFALSVLHSAVDLQDCLRTMESTSPFHTPRRRVLLASAIADSSVTIPGVTCVIDLCRALEVRWSLESKQYIPKTVWASHSVCDQRKGRTGRTCPGRVFRLLPQAFYITKLPKWEIPQLTLSSCHKEVLALCCANNVWSTNPIKLLHECLDVPDLDVMNDAIRYLTEIKACQREGPATRKSGARLVPTTYGLLLDAIPLNVGDSKVVLAGAQLGLLHETLVLRAIINQKPNPIMHYFGDPETNQGVMEKFYLDVDAKDINSQALANLSAYMFWDAEWNRKIRAAEAKLTYVKCTDATYSDGLISPRDIWTWTPETEEEHVKWCKTYHINPTAVHHVADVVDATLNVLFLAKFEPSFLKANPTTPTWRQDTTHPQQQDMFCRVYKAGAPQLCKALLALCNGKNSAAATLIAQIGNINSLPSVRAAISSSVRLPLACIHHLMGNCKFGARCKHSHSSNARKPPCRFHPSGLCTKGSSCLYSHEDDDDTEHGSEDSRVVVDHLEPLVPVIESLSLPEGPLGWFHDNCEHLLLLGEGNFSFTNALVKMHMSPSLCSTKSPEDSRQCVQIPLFGVDATKLHLDPRVIAACDKIFAFAWNFPFADIDNELGVHEALILDTFLSLSILLDEAFKQFGTSSLHLALTLQGDQLSRWSVLRSASRTNWRLKAWSPFETEEFFDYAPCRNSGATFEAREARFYVFSYQAVDPFQRTH
jgi:hypothetical protein